MKLFMVLNRDYCRVQHLHVAKVVVVAEPMAKNTEPFRRITSKQNGKSCTKKKMLNAELVIYDSFEFKKIHHRHAYNGPILRVV